MKPGFVLYRHSLTRENYDFARQCGATHVVVHLTDYFGGSTDNTTQPSGSHGGWSRAGDPGKPWTADELAAIKREINDAGLELAALENIDPAFWHDVLLDGPLRDQQIVVVQNLIRDMGEVGIPALGYYFSLAGVACRANDLRTRGNARTIGMTGADDTPIPNGMVWNMVYDPEAPAGTMPPTTADDMWDRLGRFLDDVLPVAEAAGVKLAAHPDDPPLPTLRGTPRLIHHPDHYQRLIERAPSPNSGLEFCVGTLAEMPGTTNIVDVVDRYARQGRIVYVHLRNIIGKAPYYKETFIDDGDTDVVEVLRTLKRHDFDGVIIPDHTPEMSCAAPWHAGMAYAMGYINALLGQIT